MSLNVSYHSVLSVSTCGIQRPSSGFSGVSLSQLSMILVGLNHLTRIAHPGIAKGQSSLSSQVQTSSVKKAWTLPKTPDQKATFSEMWESPWARGTLLWNSSPLSMVAEHWEADSYSQVLAFIPYPEELISPDPAPEDFKQLASKEPNKINLVLF